MVRLESATWILEIGPARVFAEAQFGAFSRDQSVGADMSDAAITRRLGTRRWVAILPSVYRMASAPESWRMRAMAALLWAGDDSALAYRAAAALWRLDDTQPGWVELYVPRRQQPPVNWLIVHKNALLPADEIRVLGPLRLTSPARTVLDLGAVMRVREVEHAMEDAVRRKLTDFVELNRVLRRHAASGRNGAGVLRSLLESRMPDDAVLRTRFERRTLRLIKGARLPTPARLYLVFDNDGYPFAEIDLAYPKLKLGIECDSYGFHSGREAWEAISRAETN